MPRPAASADVEIEAEAAALSDWELHHGVQFPGLYRSVVTEYQALFFGEAAVPFGVFGRFAHAQPISMFVFRVIASKPLRRPGRSMEGSALDIGAAIDELALSNQAGLRNALVPFSGDSHGWFCFDFSYGPGPAVVFFDPERDWHNDPGSGLRYVAESFRDFLARLEYPNEHGEYQSPAGSSHVASPAQRSWESHRDRSLV